MSPAAHLKSAVRALLPGSMRAALRRYRQAWLGKPHSAEEVFSRIYAEGSWGGPQTVFCSGSGSHDAQTVAPYLAVVKAELQRLNAASMTAVDLGCGDFSIGRQIAPHCGRYIGVDIVRPLIDHNRSTFGCDRITFRHADIIEGELPGGDICFVRQVFQHLSNAQILTILPKLAIYRWCFITEHHPSAGLLSCVNIDKPPGADIRLYRGK